jgi:hypothetical protein
MTHTTEAYLAEHARLTAELDGLADARPGASVKDGDDIVRFLRDLKAAWKKGGDAERAGLIASVYDRIVATDQGIVEVELTEDAKRHGLALALPSAWGNGILPTVMEVVMRPRQPSRLAFVLLYAGHLSPRMAPRCLAPSHPERSWCM